MAKSPVKRRGISLDPRADTAGPLTELTSRTLVSVAALGYHAWPRVQGVAGELARARTDLNRVAPELQAVRQQLASDLGHVSGTMTSVRQDVSGVRSDLASLRKTVDGLPARGDGEQADSAT